MIFWDSSALVPLLVAEADSIRRAALLRSDPVITAWWGTLLECESALHRRAREKSLPPDIARAARARLAELATHWHEILPSIPLRALAVRLIRTHPLRAADALQLAAALTLCEALGKHVAFVTADARLADAAEIEGIPVTR